MGSVPHLLPSGGPLLYNLATESNSCAFAAGPRIAGSSASLPARFKAPGVDPRWQLARPAFALVALNACLMLRETSA